MNSKQFLLIVFLITKLFILENAEGAAAAAGAGAGACKASGDIKRGNENPAIVKILKNPRFIAFSPDGKFAAIASKELISAYSVDRTTGIFTHVPNSTFEPHVRTYLDSFVYSPTNNIAAAMFVKEIKVYRVDRATGKLVQASSFKMESNQGNLESFAFSPDGNFIAVSLQIDRGIQILRVNKDTSELTLVADSNIALGQAYDQLAYSPEGDFAIGVKQGYVTDSAISMFRVNAQTGAWTLVPGYPVILKTPPNKITYSPNGKFVAITHSKGVNVYAVNRPEGTLTPIFGSPFVAGKDPQTIMYHPSGNFAAVVNRSDNTVSVYSVSDKTGGFASVAGSPFKTGSNPFGMAYHPDGNIAAVANNGDDTISIYEINQDTGAFTPLTGQLLGKERRRLEMEQVRKAIIEPGPLGAKGVEDLLSQYVGASQEKKSVVSKPDEQALALAHAIAKTKSEQDDATKAAVRLFQAIKEGNKEAFDVALTPFTVNARDETNRTPLMEAVQKGNASMVEKLLAYRGIKQHSEKHADIESVNLNMVDFVGNTALILAIVAGRYDFALQIARLMSSDGLKIANKEGKTAFSLAIKQKDTAKKNADFQALMEVLEKNIKSKP